MKRIAINGLGRIGRLVLRNFIEAPPDDIEIVAANDLTPMDDLAYLMRYDSVHGRSPFEVKFGEGFLDLGGRRITVSHEKDPANLPWKALGIDIVLECTGAFRKRADAAKHIAAGASRVIISAPSEDVDGTFIIGVNEKTYDPAKHHVISNASCTTNSLAPTVKVLNDTFGVEYLFVTTIHAYTSSQSLVDKAARKMRRGRAAGVSFIPTSTGAADATALVIPELAGRMNAVAVRAPVPDGSLTDIVAVLKKDVTVESINGTFKAAAEGPLEGILAYSEDELVSADIIGCPHSGVIDSLSTMVIMNRFVKLFVWYDNEYGYSHRMLDLAQYISRA
ncbi:MAG: type I glyceraldehyde-3-phosphate dehydrogenase [Deltaproteobacteria bacterium]|nr:type I glyceraldehyde-3-phosphate dehydrogenase [Candidatus Zymogenaceae bacterium]